MRTTMMRLAATLMLLGASAAHADWHSGNITQISFGYDGSTVAFTISGYSRSDCTCVSAWPNMACLDRARVSFREEYAFLLSARARGTPIAVNLDETTCRVVAMYEIN